VPESYAADEMEVGVEESMRVFLLCMRLECASVSLITIL